VTVDWAERALAQLQAAHDYIARSSPGYARLLVDRIVTRADGLARLPEIGAVVPEYEDEGIREVFEHPYRILYRVEDDRVQVVAVIHAARQLPRNPPG
jgi:toxin ParE1/3/4